MTRPPLLNTHSSIFTLITHKYCIYKHTHNSLWTLDSYINCFSSFDSLGLYSLTNEQLSPSYWKRLPWSRVQYFCLRLYFKCKLNAKDIPLTRKCLNGSEFTSLTSTFFMVYVHINHFVWQIKTLFTFHMAPLF